MLVDHGLELLTESECRDLLEAEQVGRVAISVGALPAIFPVNYRVIDGDIFFRTGSGLKHRAALSGSVVGFEIDRVDPVSATGWSVLVVGVAREMPAGSELPSEHGRVLPWAGGERPHIIRIHPEVISGRRIISSS